MVAVELGQLQAGLDRPVPTVASFSGRTAPQALHLHRNRHTCSVAAIGRTRRAGAIPAQVASAEAPAIPKPGTLPPKIVNVSLGDRSYPIYIGEALLNDAEIVSRHVHGSQILVVTNETIAPLYLDRQGLFLLHHLAMACNFLTRILPPSKDCASLVCIIIHCPACMLAQTLYVSILAAACELLVLWTSDSIP